MLPQRSKGPQAQRVDGGLALAKLLGDLGYRPLFQEAQTNHVTLIVGQARKAGHYGRDGFMPGREAARRPIRSGDPLEQRRIRCPQAV